jgi:FHS family L-fucose permease-like MFS transporter
MKMQSLSHFKKTGFSPIFIIGTLFFLFGFVTWLNAVLIPYLKLACELNNFESYLVAFAFYISYFFMAIPSAWVLKYLGFKKGMGAGLIIMAIGALIFIPAALTRAYWVFLLGLFVQGAGLTVLQIASNPYITMLGPISSAAKRISMMGICNKVAGAIAPIVLGAITLKDVDSLKEGIILMSSQEKNAKLDVLAERVIIPYLIIVVVLILLSLLIYKSSLPEIEAENIEDMPIDHKSNKTSVFQFPNLLMGALAIFMYVGVEVIAGDTIINYGVSQGIPLATAKFFTTCTLVGMILGYLIGVFCIPRYFTQSTALKLFSVLGLLFSMLILFTDGYLSVLGVALLGFANSLLWPGIWPTAMAGLGKFTRIGSSLLIMGIAGGAVLPLIYGALADASSLHHAYWVVVPCYLFIGLYALIGEKLAR